MSAHTEAEWKAEMWHLLEALRTYGVHAKDCASYREIGRFGSMSGLYWSERSDRVTCDCGLGAAIAKATRGDR